MAPVIIYVNWLSPSCLGLYLVCRKAGIEVEYRSVEIATGEQLNPEFTKLNPEHCVPTVVDGDFVLWESRACAKYLLDKYAPNHTLYPHDLQKRAVIEKMLYQDIGMVYKTVADYAGPRIYSGKETSPTEMEKIFERFDTHVFKEQDYAAGPDLTIADLFLLTSSLSLLEIVGYTIPHDRFTHMGSWLEKIKESGWYKNNTKEYDECKGPIMELIAKRDQNL